MKLISQMSIRRQNLSRIVDVLSAGKAVTRQELARQTSLSLMTVSNLIDVLAAQGVLDISLDRKNAVSIGRPAERILLSEERHSLAVIDLTTSAFRCDHVSLSGSLQGTGQAWTRQAEHDFPGNLELFLQDVRQGFLQLGRTILGVAVVVPGPYDAACDRVINKRIPALNDLPLKETVSRHLGTERVFVDEDVKFAVQAHLDLAPKGSGRLMYYLYLGEGVGGAIVSDGGILRGLNSIAGDIGQLRVGQDDTFEERASSQAFLGRLGARAGSPDEALDAIRAVRDGDPVLLEGALSALAAEVSDMLNALCWILDPHDVVIDCRYLAERERERLDCMIAARLEALVWDGAVKLPQIHMSGGSFSKISLGAARTLRDVWIRDISFPQGNKPEK